MRKGPVVVAWALVGLLAVAAMISVSSAAAQTYQTQQVMRQKLIEAEGLLAALVTSNWAALDGHTRALEAVTNQPGWDVLQLPEFRRYTAAFRTAVRDLADAADERSLPSALAAYNGLVASCVECHRYVARARIARAR